MLKTPEVGDTVTWIYDTKLVGIFLGRLRNMDGGLGRMIETCEVLFPDEVRRVAVRQIRVVK